MIMEKDHKELIFRQVCGTWLQINSPEQTPPTLAEWLESLQIVIDDDAEFCRIKRYFADEYQTIIYRAYNQAKITINIHWNKYD